MTLTLDDVRNTKFRMARRQGYEVIDVDQFVDQVEDAFAQLTEENQMLKRQVEALQQSQPQDSDRDAQAFGRNQGSPESPATPVSAPTPQAQQAQPSQTQQPQSQQPQSQQPQQATAQVAEGGQTTVVTTSAEASPAVIRLVQLATEQSERLVEEANEQAAKVVDDAKQTAHEITTDARTKAERVESEARVNAEKMTSDAHGRSTALDLEIETRRTDMFGQLEQQRDELQASVADLRNFESHYRSNLTAHLRGQIDTLEGSTFEPSEKPSLVPDANSTEGPAGAGSDAGSASQGNDGDQGASNTPRLDALMGDQNS